MGQQIVFPAAAFIAMAVEALCQSRLGIQLTEGSVLAEKHRYRLRNIRFPRALSLEETGDGHKIMLTLAASPGTKDSWHEFNISSLNGDVWSEHCRGLICAEEDVEQGN
jgi:Polyketide synthase dehydratase